MKTVFKIRSRTRGIITTTHPEKHDVVWKREFNPEIYPMDRPKNKESNLNQELMKASNAFKETIKAYLEKRASEDELFAITYQKENKNLDECCDYVMQCAKSGGFSGYADQEVFGWAVHYYDEDDIKNIKPVSGKVIVNHAVELTEEDKKLAKDKAMELVIEESKAEAKEKLSKNIELSEEDILEAKNIAIEKVVSEQKEKLVAKAAKKKSGIEVEQIDLFG